MAPADDPVEVPVVSDAEEALEAELLADGAAGAGVVFVTGVSLAVVSLARLHPAKLSDNTVAMPARKKAEEGSFILFFLEGVCLWTCGRGQRCLFLG